jgi:hypothetical protein
VQPDVALPDLLQPDQSSTLYYTAAPGTDSADFETTGTFNAQGSNLCGANPAWPQRARLLPSLISATDYTAETSLYFTYTPTSDSSAGLLARAVDISGGSLDAYSCVVRVNTRRLSLSRYTSSNWSLLALSAPNTVPASGPYQIQFSVKGSDLTCKLLPSGPTLTATHSQFSSGPPGFITYESEACFQYLLVTAP